MALDLPILKSKTVNMINAVVTAYDTTNLRHALATYPQRIKKQRDTVAQARKAYRDAEQKRAEIEAEMILDIATATDEKGKPAFSNAEARAAALTSMKSGKTLTLGASPQGYDYQDAVTTLQNAEIALTEATDTLTMLLDEYQSARIAARSIAAEMAVLSELIDVGEREEVEVKGAIRIEIPGLEEAIGGVVSGAIGGFGLGKSVVMRGNAADKKEAF